MSQIVQITEDIQGATSRLDYSYDSKGQLISVVKDSSPLGEYEYDATDGGQTTELAYDGSELISAKANGKIITYGRDTLGRRVWRGVFDKRWLYDDTGRPFGEVDGNGDLVSRFIYARLTVFQPIWLKVVKRTDS